LPGSGGGGSEDVLNGDRFWEFVVVLETDGRHAYRTLSVVKASAP
jgi:hypothetical protein